MNENSTEFQEKLELEVVQNALELDAKISCHWILFLAQVPR